MAGVDDVINVLATGPSFFSQRRRPLAALTLVPLLQAITLATILLLSIFIILLLRIDGVTPYTELHIIYSHLSLLACAMKHSNTRTMAATPWLLLLICLAAAGTAGVLQARAQPDSNGVLNVSPHGFTTFSEPT